MRLFIARHGATQHNLDGRLTGQIDAPLSALGERQAEALAARLANWRFDAIIASDLIRASATAAAIAKYHEAPILLDADLREIDMGDWAGRPYAEWSDEERLHFEAMECDPTGSISAPGGESFATLADRAQRALRRTREGYPDGTVLWVAHGGTISVLLVNALKLGFHQRRQFRRSNCSLFELHYRGENVIIERLNDISHLETLEASEPGEARQAL